MAWSSAELSQANTTLGASAPAAPTSNAAPNPAAITTDFSSWDTNPAPKAPAPAPAAPAPISGNSFMTAAGKDLQDLGGQLGNRLNAYGKTFQDTASGKINPIETGIQTVGNTIGAAGDVIGAGLHGALQGDKAIAKTVAPDQSAQAHQIFSQVMSSPIGQAGIKAIGQGVDAYKTWKQANPNAAKDLESVGNIASLFPAEKLLGAGLKAGGEAAKGALSGAKDLAAGARNVLPSVAKDVAEKAATAPSAFKSAMNQRAVNGTIKDLSKVEKATGPMRNIVQKNAGLGFDSKQELAKAGYLNGSVDRQGVITTKGEGGAVNAYHANEIAPVEDAVHRSLIQEGKSIPLSHVEDTMRQAVKSEGLMGENLTKANSKIDAEIKGYQTHLDPTGKVPKEDLQMPLSDVHAAKVDKYNNINYMGDTQQADKLVAKSLKGLVEDNSNSDVKAMNADLSKHFANQQYLQTLDGRRIEGGRLGKYAAGTIGAIAGSHFGPLGTIGGAEIGSALKGASMAGKLGGGSGTVGHSPEMLKAMENLRGQEAKIPKFDAGAKKDGTMALNGTPRTPSSGLTTTVDKNAEKKGFDYIDKNAQKIIKQYTADHGKFVNVDDVRKYLPTDGVGRAGVTHEPASEIGKILQQNHLDSLKPGDKMSFLAGGGGSGKTTAAGTIHPFENDKYVIDGVFGDAKKAENQIKQVLAKGGDPTVKYVARGVSDAWHNGVIPRAIRSGRTVPLHEFLKGTEGSYKTMNHLLSNPDLSQHVRLVDNTLGQGKQAHLSLDKFKKLDYTNLVDKHYEQLKNETTEKFRKGEIPADIYKGLIGG